MMKTSCITSIAHAACRGVHIPAVVGEPSVCKRPKHFTGCGACSRVRAVLWTCLCPCMQQQLVRHAADDCGRCLREATKPYFSGKRRLRIRDSKCTNQAVDGICLDRYIPAGDVRNCFPACPPKLDRKGKPLIIASTTGHTRQGRNTFPHGLLHMQHNS